MHSDFRTEHALLRLFMRRPLVAPRTEFFIFDAAGLLLLVLRGRVIAALARRTFQSDNISHCSSFLVYSELATGIEPVTSSLPRKCSTN